MLVGYSVLIGHFLSTSKNKLLESFMTVQSEYEITELMNSRIQVHSGTSVHRICH